MNTRRTLAGTLVAVVMLIGPALAGCSSDGSDGGSDAAEAADGAAPTEDETTTTVAETTTTTDPGPQEGDQAGPEELKEAVLDGQYVAQMTVRASNYPAETGVEVGEVNERRYTMSTECADSGNCKTQMVNHTADDTETEFDLVDGVATFEDSTPSGCIRDDGSEYATGLIESRRSVSFTISAAVYRDGRWIATAFEGPSRTDDVVVDEAGWASEGCPWSTTDGQPTHMEWEITAQLQES